MSRDFTNIHPRRWPLWAVAGLVLAVAAWYTLRGRSEDAGKPLYRTEAAVMGTLVVDVSTTGKLLPTNQVDVGSELSGSVDKVFVDDNDQVKKGQLLAILDLSKLSDAVARSHANHAAAEAQVVLAQATVEEARGQLTRLRQVAELSAGRVPSRLEMDGAEASLRRAEASEANARAMVSQALAARRTDATNLAKAHIRSPIDGLVLARKVQSGQTVAASFQAPVLFTIAQDLSKMELQVEVDEADVGQVRNGQQARFGVDAWPGRSYEAVITRVGYGAHEKDGVVTYTAVLRVDNTDLSLRPGMTGSAQIRTLVRDDVLLVPNAALRFAPATDEAAPKSSGTPVVGSLLLRLPSQPSKVKAVAQGAATRVWVLRDGQPVLVGVKTGASDGRVTEVVGGDLKPGMEVITETVGAQP